MSFTHRLLSAADAAVQKSPSQQESNVGRNMHFTIEVDQTILRAELFHRQTAEEMQEFIGALKAEIRKSGCHLILVHVRHSQPLFKPEQYADLTRLAGDGSIRVALVSDSAELRASHHYVELLMRQHGANVRGFNDCGSAFEWLRKAGPKKDPPGPPDEAKRHKPGG
jgi:hypothetical protein